MSKNKIIKKMKKNTRSTIEKNEKDIFFKFVTVLTIIILMFILVYFFIGVFYTKEINFNNKNNNNDNDTIDIDNSMITLGQLFDQPQNEYYVLIYDINDKKSVIPTWLSIFESKNNTTIYRIDSKNKFNSKYLTTDDGNNNVSSYSNLKVKSPTLIKINNKTVSNYIEGEENIKNYFKNN